MTGIFSITPTERTLEDALLGFWNFRSLKKQCLTWLDLTVSQHTSIASKSSAITTAQYAN
jgi:hypothetical protein